MSSAMASATLVRISNRWRGVVRLQVPNASAAAATASSTSSRRARGHLVEQLARRRVAHFVGLAGFGGAPGAADEVLACHRSPRQILLGMPEPARQFHDVGRQEGSQARESATKHGIHNDFLAPQRTGVQACGPGEPALRRAPCVGGDTTTDDVIQLERVSKRFGQFVAVHEADFGIARGEFFAMLGPVRLREDDDPAHDRRVRGTLRRARSASRARTSRASRPTSATSTPSSSTTRCSRTCRSGTTSPSGRSRARSAATRSSAASASCSRSCASRTSRTASRASCPVASSNGSRSPARSSTTRARCSSTSRSPRST